MKKYLILLAVLAIVFQSCAKIYYTADSASLAQNHRLIAVAPPSVSIAGSEKIDLQSLIEQQKTASVNFQIEMYNQLLERERQGLITVKIQDFDTTIAKLRRAGYYDGTLLSPLEICWTLDVDGVITSNCKLSKPISKGEAVVSGLFSWAILGHFLDIFTNTTNTVKVSIGILDFKTKKMIWNYDNILSSGILSTNDQLVNTLMIKASRKMPYNIKKK